MLVILQQTDARNCIPIIALLVKRNQDKTSTNKGENQSYQFFSEKFPCNRTSLSVPVSDHLDNFFPLSFPFLSYLLPFYFWPLSTEPLLLIISAIITQSGDGQTKSPDWTTGEPNH